MVETLPPWEVLSKSWMSQVLGAIQKVSLTTHPGIATVPLQVQIVEQATGIRCCAETDGETLDCVEAQPSLCVVVVVVSYCELLSLLLF